MFPEGRKEKQFISDFIFVCLELINESELVISEA